MGVMRQLGNILVRLNLETRAVHAAADRTWLRLIAGDRIPTEQDYARALVRVYGFDAPLEAAVAYTPHFETLVDMVGRYRSGLIAQDLLTLGLTPAQVAALPQCMIEPFGGVIEALGWLYVHERATLCHDRVRRHLIARIPALATATSYLSAYTGAVGVRFDDLGRILDRYARTPELERRIMTGAHEGFRALLGWLDGEEARYAR
jgi:heme oxygenase